MGGSYYPKSCGPGFESESGSDPYLSRVGFRSCLYTEIQFFIMIFISNSYFFNSFIIKTFKKKIDSNLTMKIFQKKIYLNFRYDPDQDNL